MTTALLQKNLSRNKSIGSNHSGSSAKTLTVTSRSKTKKSKLAKSESSVSISATMNHDKSIKLVLKHFKRLEIGLSKFNSKSSGVLTTNILRIVVLPFLRSKSLTKLLSDIETSIGFKIYQSLVSILASLLTKWWDSLLTTLLSPTALPSIDRSAYLECISRIISRDEWFHPNNDLIEKSTKESYTELLVLTLDYSITKLASIKHLPLSISAFVGKVFAYSFFKVEGVSNALLFLLNVKQAVFKDNVKMFSDMMKGTEDLKQLYRIFPKHLHYLIEFDGLQNKDLSKQQKLFLNCLVPPKQQVKGIKDPSGLWVRRWLNSDSDIFNSFLRHYFCIVHHCLGINKVAFSDRTLLNVPGFNIILSHIYQILQISITHITKNNSTVKMSQDFQLPKFSSPSSSPNGSKFNLHKQNGLYYNSIFKFFRTLRDLKFNMENVEGDEVSDMEFVKSITHYVDVILINFAKKTTIYDFNKNSLMLNIVYEYVHYLNDVDWVFWLNCCYLMIEHTDYIQILLKNLAFLFNIWDRIPEIVNTGSLDVQDIAWLTNNNESFKKNFTNWIISDKMWEKLFIHWNPIVRNYYLRFLIWRVIGINNFESSTSIKTSLEIQNKLRQSYKVFEKFLAQNQDKNLYFKPDNPVINRKMTVVPVTKDEIMLNEISTQDDETEVPNLYIPGELKKTHPFEIFDEAIYSCSNLPKEENEEDFKRSNSLVNSIGKIFKILSVDDAKNQKKSSSNLKGLESGSKSVSLTSLSTYSLKSRSSSPLLMSFSSSPTSLTDLSETASSITTGSTTTSEQKNPLKIFNFPPDIVRPVYKFELVPDQDALRDKFYLMNNRRYVFKNHDYYGLPSEPKVPSVSIYLQSDMYSRFYISTDNFFLTVEDEKMAFEEKLFSGLNNSKTVNFINLGKSLFDWTAMVEEFEDYLTHKVEVDQFNESLHNFTNEFDYFRKIIPLLSLDSNNSKTMNAA